MADRGWSRGRCLVRRRCVTCAQVTKHAYLRDNDDAADFAEMLDSAGAALDRGTELLEEVAWLRTCDVIVTFEDPSQFEAGEAVVIWQLLNDGGHVLWLNSGHPAGQLLDGLQYVCGQLAGGILDDPCTPWRVWVGCDEAPPVRRLGFGMEGGG